MKDFCHKCHRRGVYIFESRKYLTCGPDALTLRATGARVKALFERPWPGAPALSHIELNLSALKVIPMTKRLVLVLAASLFCGLWFALSPAEGKRATSAEAALNAPPQNAANDVNEQIRLLESNNASTRSQAACKLGSMGKRAVPAIPALIKLLGDDTPAQRFYCEESGSWRGPQTNLDRSSPGEQAATALILIGEPAVGPLVVAARSDDWRVRANATWALGVVKDPRALEAVLDAVRDQDWHVREKAAWALGLKWDKRVPDALVGLLTDTVWQVRSKAAWALALKGDAHSVEPLIFALRDENFNVRHQAVWALGLKGDSRAVEPLIGMLQDENKYVRGQAAWALGLKGNRTAVEPLIVALRDEWARVRQQSAWALGLKGDSRAVEALNAALTDSEEPVRKTAAWALRLIRIKSGNLRQDDLRKLDEDDDVDVDVDENVDVNVDVDVRRH
jgi:HEAT repeat protein